MSSKASDVKRGGDKGVVGASSKLDPAIPRDAWISSGVTAVALGYASLRYNVFKGVPWADWPSYTVNKAFAVAALLLIAGAVIRLARRQGRTGFLLAVAGALAFAHSLLSFALFTPLYYERLFAAGKLTFVGGISVTLGVAAMVAMELGARKSGVWSSGLRHQVLAFTAFTTGTHAALPGLSTWIEPATWPGGLPPITLISFLVGALAFGAWLRTRSRRT